MTLHLVFWFYKKNLFSSTFCLSYLEYIVALRTLFIEIFLLPNIFLFFLDKTEPNWSNIFIEVSKSDLITPMNWKANKKDKIKEYRYYVVADNAVTWWYFIEVNFLGLVALAQIFPTTAVRLNHCMLLICRKSNEEGLILSFCGFSAAML